MTPQAPSAVPSRTDGALRRAVLRASPVYELVPLERLTEEERAVLRGSADGDDLYGLLRPVGDSTVAPRSATPDLALLVLTLREPGPLPAFAARRLGDEAEEAIARLVLDGVLELEQAGSFVSGPGSLPGTAGPGEGGDAVAALSLAALRHAQSLVGVPEELLTLSLYCFGRRPFTPRLASRLPDEQAVAGFLRIAAVAAGTRWIESGTSAGDPWRMWRRRRPQARRGRGGASFKLYVAPVLEALPDTLAAVAECLGEIGGCEGFKVARDAAGLCRPDKLVAYFERLEDLHDASGRLGTLLRGTPAQPVPFSGGVDAGGLLSWGVDPSGGSQVARSWRLWLAGRLASYLVEARIAGGAGEPWRFALERIRLDGIDVESWTPSSTGWKGTR